ncbi:uncharacterized protein N7515_010160 [Penicillium bovifimosum]|uniref:Uncharacterized protein n=1 Tax=Penicillium bovifimosum TaxID=126998 RepID=A0A9W9KUU3_9EURO|nr:uncharacterized protein N7515_010160 [Penicillium bovifimosum]KAJ5120772.1 hypothetical protein N7515_010160 [Penicillium bovifimosum]
MVLGHRGPRNRVTRPIRSVPEGMDPLLVDIPPVQPVNQPKSAPSTNPTRQRRAYNRRIPSKQSAGYEESELPARQRYDRMVKWHVLCHFNLNNINAVILNAYPDTAPPSSQHTKALNIAKDIFKAWKCNTPKALKVLIAAIIDKSEVDDSRSRLNSSPVYDRHCSELGYSVPVTRWLKDVQVALDLGKMSPSWLLYHIS